MPRTSGVLEEAQGATLGVDGPTELSTGGNGKGVPPMIAHAVGVPIDKTLLFIKDASSAT